MSNEESFPLGRAVPRVDSFEVIALDGIELTDEEKSFPLGRAVPRVDSFEVIECPVTAAGQEVGLRVSIPADATTDEAAAVIQQLRSTADTIRATTGGRFVIRLDAPTA